MPKGKRSKPMECCGSLSLSRHMAGCKEAGKAKPQKSAPPAQGGRPGKVVALRQPRAARKPGALDALLVRRSSLVKERQRIEAELADVSAQAREALAREEERIADLRTKVEAEPPRAAGAE